MIFEKGNIGKKVLNTRTGEIGVFNSMCDEPSFNVDLDSGHHSSGGIHSLHAQEWDLFEESKKTLSSKKDRLGSYNKVYFHYDDVQDSIKEYIESIRYRKNPSNMKDHIEDAKRIFGKELTEE